MELKDTIKLMQSDDYKERFKAEYYQLKNRLEGLQRMLTNWDEGKLNFKPTCPKDIYNSQLIAMGNYLSILGTRAMIENIEL